MSEPAEPRQPSDDAPTLGDETTSELTPTEEPLAGTPTETVGGATATVGGTTATVNPTGSGDALTPTLPIGAAPVDASAFGSIAEAETIVADSRTPTETVDPRPTGQPAGADPLAATEVAGTQIDDASWISETRQVPLSIGPYRVVSILGEGGMGSVFLAEQEEPVERTVAIKLIRSSLTSPAAVVRFSAERQAMARLAHPAIAQMYEAGTTDDGFPYFVMERVEGEALNQFCNHRSLGLRQRLALFIEICHGVEHAHRKGILHRDLKPGNILVAEVEGRPAPKIIDFGIAKAVDRPLTESTLQTGGGIGTPSYMSPEALDGVDVDTRTDVYALGVILYELVVGQKPFELRGASMTDIVRTIIEEEASRPSLRFLGLDAEEQARIAQQRGLAPDTLQQRLEGDLDWIVGKALEKPRERRYGSATELADDVGRHLDDEAVLASPPSTRYRLGKLVRRNRAAVTAGALALLMLILGIVGTTVGMVRARSAAERAHLETERTREALLDAEEVTNFLVELFEVADPREAGGESTTARQLLDRGADRIETELAGQPLRQARLMHTIGSIYDQLQVYPEAKQLVSTGLELREERLADDHPDLGESLHRLAVIERQLAEYDAAEDAARRALALRETAYGPEHPEVGETLRELAVVLYLAGRYDEAEPVVRRSLSIAENVLGRDDPAVAFSLETLGNLLKDQGRCAEAIPSFERSLAIREQSFGTGDPRLAYALNNLASCYGEGGRYEEALPLFERALAIQEKTLGADSTAVAMGRANLGIVYRSLEDFTAAEQALTQARDDLAAALGPNHPWVANPQAELGVLFGQMGRFEEAESALQEALDAWLERPGPDHPLTAWAHWGLANVLRDSGQLAASEPHYRRALEVREAVLPADHADVLQTREDYGAMLRRAGRDAEAAALGAAPVDGAGGADSR